jgi:DNA-binding protein HU-beta
MLGVLDITFSLGFQPINFISFSLSRGIVRGITDMNKAELIDAVADSADISKAAAGRAVDGAISAITNALRAGDSVTLVGFGTFTVRSRQARTGRNPRTGQEIQIRASKVPGFKAGKALKDAIN